MRHFFQSLSAYQKKVVFIFGVLAILSATAVPFLKFTFSFEQFFPKGDADLTFYRDFVKDFETDDNFLLIAVRRPEGAFEEKFLHDFHDFTLKTCQLPHVTDCQSLTKIDLPLKTPFGFATLPAIHLDEPEKYASDQQKLLKDTRFLNNLVSEDATTLVIALKTVPNISLQQANELLSALNASIAPYHFPEYHYLGRAYFQQEFIDMQKREVMISSVISAILVTLIMFWIFGKPWGVIIGLTGIVLGMLFFLGFMGIFGREFNAISALYPVLMIIAGAFEVVHILTKYADELLKGHPPKIAMDKTIQEIGLASLLTSSTTAIGFLSLVTNRVQPVCDFGINAGVGVMIMYFTVIVFCHSMLPRFSAMQVIRPLEQQSGVWEKIMLWFIEATQQHKKGIVIGTIVALLVSFWGISSITTNYTIQSNLPRGKKITADYEFFEQQFAGFRPFEIAVFAKSPHNAHDFAVLKEIDKVEKHLASYPKVKNIQSVTSIQKSIRQAFHQNNPAYYTLPDSLDEYENYHAFAQKLPASNTTILVSKDTQKARITARVDDIGADSVGAIGLKVDKWIAAHTDSTVATFRRTGVSMIIDKNAEYIRVNMLQGIVLSVLIISVLMAMIFKSARMLVVFLVPNLIPLIVVAGFIGFMGIELEAGISIVFSVVFGIAVDDTIHFLSRYKIARSTGLLPEASLRITLLETGKATCLTTIVLFFGFLVMLFSIHPPTVMVGLLIAFTLVVGLLCELLILPVMLRWLE
jgi:uncharacterized protein